MNIERYLPAERLLPFIKTFLLIESKEGMTNRILPGTSLVMAFNYKGEVSHGEGETRSRLPTSTITGLRKSPRLLTYSEETATLLVLFKEGGASAFFRTPLQELFGRSLSLNQLMAAYPVKAVEEQLAEAHCNQQRIAIVERFLLAQLKIPPSDPLVSEAVQRIKLASGNIRIQALLTDLPISRDPFEKRFRRLIGISPKQFATIIRLREVINSPMSAESLTRTAYAVGYFDQAHFSRDFQSFTGQTPRTFFQSASYW